ncbi:MAG TPA: hypothetical protein VLJ79_24210 [Candidatus Binatia bacterium]|nr:hypothetical protein [Candidatus Binatia bacterium]
MSFYKKGCLMVTAVFLGFSLAACEKKAGEGPAERAGKEVDKAMEKTGQAMEKAADAVKEAAKDAEKAVTATKDK